MSRAAYDTDYGAGIEDVDDLSARSGRSYRSTGRDDAGVFPLFKRLADEVTTLFTKEIALLKVETTSAINDTRTGIASMAAGGAVLYAGFLFLLVSAMAGLAQVMDLWLAALIVGAVVLIIGAIMLSSGKKKLEPSAFRPQHTQASLEKDRNMVKRSIHESHER